MMKASQKMIMKVIRAKKLTKESLLQIQITLTAMLHLLPVIRIKELEELAANRQTMQVPPMTKSTRNNALSAHFSMI